MKYLLAGRRPQDPTYFLTSDWIREAIASLSLNSSYIVVSLSMIIGAIFAYASAKGADILVGSAKVPA